MTKRTRTILFLFLLLLFAILAPSTILYSQGYRIDWKAKRIVQIGAFYFKVTPATAQILINEKSVKTTDFLFGSALVGNLLPRSYLIEISKEGYQSWQKQLEIKEKGVTDAKNIILFPEVPKFRIAADRVIQDWQSPQRKTILLQKEAPGKTWKLVLMNLGTGGEETIFTSKSKEEIWDAQWSSDGTRILLSLASEESIHSLVLSLEKNQPCSTVPCDLGFLGGPIDAMMFSPASRDRIIFAKFLRNTQILREADYVKKEVGASFGNNVVTFASAGSTLLWLESDGKLWQKALGSQAPALFVSSLPYPVKQETEYDIYTIGDILFLKEGIKLLQSQQQESTLQEVFSGVKTIATSPDGKKLALSNDAELWVLYLQDSQDQPLHAAGDKVFLTRLSKPIENLAWVSAHYLVFSAESDIQIMEIDDRDGINTAHIAQFQNPKLFWQEPSKILTVLSEKNLYISEELVR